MTDTIKGTFVCPAGHSVSLYFRCDDDVTWIIVEVLDAHHDFIARRRFPIGDNGAKRAADAWREEAFFRGATRDALAISPWLRLLEAYSKAQRDAHVPRDWVEITA